MSVEPSVLAAQNYRASAAILKESAHRLEEAAVIAETTGSDLQVNGCLTNAFNNNVLDAINLKQAGDKIFDHQKILKTE